MAVALLGALGALLALASGADGAQRTISVHAVYRAPACPSGGSMNPLPAAKLIVRAGSQTIRTQLDEQGSARFRVDESTARLRATAVLDGRLLEVEPYDTDRAYSYPGAFDLTQKRNYTLRVGQLADAGAASAWSILSQGPPAAQGAMPAGTRLAKVTARYAPGSGPTAGLPDMPGTETGYVPATHEILIDSRTTADEFEPWTLLHEYGHHLLSTVADPGPDAGGPHNLRHSYPNQPALPWSEGFAHAFAAIARDKSVLRTLCRAGVDLSSSPVPPPVGDPWLTQYHEISVAGALWAVASHLGGGDPQAGLEPLLAALHAYHTTHGGPESLREARDALSLAPAGRDQAGYDALNAAFSVQRMGWGWFVTIGPSDPRTAGSFADSELRLVLTGPAGRCELGSDSFAFTVGAEGGLPRVSGLFSDDCMLVGDDGKAPNGQTGGGAFALGYPYLAGQSGDFVLRATWVCRDHPPPSGDPPEYRCTQDREFSFGTLYHGLGPGGVPFFPARFPPGLSFRLGNRTPAALLRFDALGKCRIVATGSDCTI